MKLSQRNVNQFINSYIDTIFAGEQLHGYNITDEFLKKVTEDCNAFLKEARQYLLSAQEMYNYGDDYGLYVQAGSDFYTTRQGIGNTFNDRGIGDLGEDLTNICNKFGSFDILLNGENLDIE